MGKSVVSVLKMKIRIEWLVLKTRFQKAIAGDLEPKEFQEANRHLGAPVGWEKMAATYGECKALPCYHDGTQFISCWKAGLWARIMFLFTGKLWIGVMSDGHPPIWMMIRKTVFIHEQKQQRKV